MKRWLCALLGVAVMMTGAAASLYAADDWMNLGTVSMTDAVTPKLTNRSICYSDGRDIACDNTSQFIQTGGLINAGALQVAGYVSAGTIHTSGTVKVSNTIYADAILVNGMAVGNGSVSGTGSPTAVAYWNSANGLTYDSDGFYWDASNNRLGLATNVPSATLHVRGQSILGSGGAFSGASVVNPVATFSDNQNDIGGILMRNGSTGTGAEFRFAIQDTDGAYLAFSAGGVNNTDTLFGIQRKSSHLIFNNSSERHLIMGTVQDRDMILGTWGVPQLRLYSAGKINIGFNNDKVGISNTSPKAKLDVVGTISASDAIQVGASTLTCASSISGSMRWGNTISTVQTLVDMNGSTDYVEAYVEMGTGTTVNGGSPSTYFAGTLLGGGGGSGGGGGGGTPAGSTGDIQFNNSSAFAADTGQLTWDATNNRLSVGSQGASSNVNIAARAGSSNAFEWGHANTSGYGNTLGFEATSGSGFLCFNCEAGTTNNTYRTRGVAGSIFKSNLAGGFAWGKAATTTADNQSIGSTMTLDDSGNLTATAFLYSSDQRLKSNIQTIDGPLDKIGLLNGVSFRFTKDGDKGRRHLGVIAQEVEKVFPETVVTDPSGTKSVDYPSLIAPLIEAVKELKAQNVLLSKEVKEGRELRTKEVDMLRDEVERLKRLVPDNTSVSETAYFRAEFKAANDNHAVEIDALRHERRVLKRAGL